MPDPLSQAERERLRAEEILGFSDDYEPRIAGQWYAEARAQARYALRLLATLDAAEKALRALVRHETYREGDRCGGCGYWYWERPAGEEGWHSLVPITYADHPEEARLVECPPCEAAALSRLGAGGEE